jgi:uncharacterized protein YbjT (DUF2867 family)
MGVDLVQADLTDEASLAAGFEGAEAAFVMLPTNHAPSPGFAEARAMASCVEGALASAKVPRVAALSSIGADRSQGVGLISQVRLLEEALDRLGTDRVLVRAAWFMENAARFVPRARDHGVLDSFLQPLDRAIPMIATADVGQAVADALLSERSGRRVVEAAGPRTYAPDDVAAALGKALGRPVAAHAVPRRDWEEQLSVPGRPGPAARIEMLAAFNSGWIAFGADGAERVAGSTKLETVIAGLAAAGPVDRR